MLAHRLAHLVVLYPLGRELELSALAGPAVQQVDRRANLSAVELWEQYFLWGRPVVIPGGIPADTPALHAWTFDTLRNLSAHHQTNIFAMPHLADGFECNVHRTSLHRTTLRDEYSLPDFLRFPGLAASGAEFVPPRLCEMFYFNAEQGRGVPTHLDSNCGASWVMQIRGVKRWTLWPPEPKNSSRADTWHFAREYETVLQPGDVIVFHPGWWHKTVQESDTPSLSLNMYLPEPLPLFFLREFDEVLVKQGRTNHCTAMWRLEARAGFGVSGVGQSVAETIWRVLDSLAEALVRAW